MQARGFILHPAFRLEGGKTVVHLFGRLESGQTFLVKDGRDAPRFWIRAEDGARARELGAAPLAVDGTVTLRGESAARVEAPTPAELNSVRDRLGAAGIAGSEADVRHAIRYLFTRGIRGAVTIEGEPRRGEGVDLVFDEPALAPSDWAPPPLPASEAGGKLPGLSVLSFDIETNRESHVLSISLVGCGASEVLLLDPTKTSTAFAIPFATERDMLVAFARRVVALDPDVLVGWNVIDFDLALLVRRAAALRIPFALGRGPGSTRVESARFRYGMSYATIPGRVVLDGIQVLRGAFIKMDEYSLDAVSKSVLGEGKLFHGPQRFEEILDSYANDKEKFVEYNLLDSKLVYDILEKLKLLELCIERSLLTGMTLDRVSASIAAFDFLYLQELSKRKIVAPSVGNAESTTTEPTSGGHVLEPAPGLYRNVMTFDFKSLYPSIIRTFQIDPLGFVPALESSASSREQTFIVAPNGAAFRREPGILPRMLDDLFPRREQAKAQGDAIKSQAIKILMNSFYGVLGTPACRFYNSDIANAITGFGRELLLWSKARFESYGYRVLYGDTDSLFVLSQEDEPARARTLGTELVARLNKELTEEIARRWNVESKLELEMENVYLRLVLPHVRNAAVGARKRYAGLVETKAGREVVFTGMEVVRRDWTELAKQVQREMYARLFDDRPVEDYVRELVADLRAGKLDDQLVYRKALRKDLEEYTATTPPHVAAARKMGEITNRLVSYVVTVSGPEPFPGATNRIDHEHYVEKQVRPVAEPVLELLGLEFDRIAGNDTQLRLFD